MLCYEITINEVETFLVGHACVENMQFSVTYHQSLSSPHTLAFAKISKPDGPVEWVEWQSHVLTIGGEVRIKIVESDTPKEPKKYEPLGTKINASGKSEQFCSFCGTSQHDSKKMFRGAGGNICGECVEMLHGYLLSS